MSVTQCKSTPPALWAFKIKMAFAFLAPGGFRMADIVAMVLLLLKVNITPTVHFCRELLEVMGAELLMLCFVSSIATHFSIGVACTLAVNADA
jgi:hypothetical protein